ncbi:MAG: hypothetical protein O3A33_02530 [Chloroflexi bacterium]|nr:hypothetical protein [Chloroflexota bacterium]
MKLAPWFLASVPAMLAISLGIDDFRESGKMTLFAVTPFSFFILLLIKRPWRARTFALRSLGTAGLLVLGVLFIGAVVDGTPSFLKEEFGLFAGVIDYGPKSITKTPDGYVVVGDDAAGNAVVWLSIDGATWSRISLTESLSGLEVADVAYTEFGIVMVGQDGVTGAAVALVSQDGTSWQRVASFGDGTQNEDAAKPAALASSGTSLALIGATYGNDSVFWYAANPREWAVGEPAPVYDRGHEPSAVVSTEAGFLAANYSKSDNGAVMFASPSGQSWTKLDVDFGDSEIASLTSFGKGVVAVGFDRDRRAAGVWVSEDGIVWVQVIPTEALQEARMDIVVTDDAKLFAFGRSLDDDTVFVWESTDGTTWKRIPVSFGEVLMRDAVLTQTGLVATGVDLKLNAAAFWTFSDGSSWHRVTHDEALFTVR